MITKIKLHNIATYSNTVEIPDLKKINFFFGSNGTGKTAISKLIANPDSYSSCQVEWQSNKKLKTIVYNEVFVERVFHQSDNFPGIFTIGEGAKNIEEQIKKKNNEREKVEEDKNRLNNTLTTKKDELQNKENNFRELCWKKIFQKYEDLFSDIFTGYRNSKENFAKRILREFSENQSQLQEKNFLISRYNLLYKEELKTINKIILITDDIFHQLKNLESEEILKTKILGKKDVDIAKMIEKLHNHDWVRQGKKYYDENYDEKTNFYICPFCQQKTTDEFKRKLEEYFDETYNNQIQEINKFKNSYSEIKSKIEQYCEQLTKSEGNKYFEKEKEKIESQIRIISGILDENLLLIDNKIDKPSESVEIKSIIEPLNDLKDLIIAINNEIEEYNVIVNNQAKEKEILNSEIWKFFCVDIEQDIQNYNQEKGNIEKAISNLEKQIEEKDKQIQEICKEISNLEKNIKSVKPTVDAINKLLKQFGFRGFKLNPSEDEKHYSIIRENGEPAKETLSEGERNFIIFLYFYHLIEGTLNPDENINESKVVVFDDPVSSLDSDVLFIVSTLIKDILRKVKNNEGNIKQVFILTHNAFFFKEVTHKASYQKRNDTMYYILRKSNNITNIEPYESNPIKSTYQLLWDNLKKENSDCICIQNTMRRIIEFYFKILANLDRREDIINKFKEETDKKICRSLISWMHVGSHDVFSDIEYSPTTEEVDKFKKVFKKIFEHTKHLSHYNMMMGINEEDNEMN
ncbi:MAG: AAA family ATPase [Candidatus Helarchaeota archaeon]